MAALCVWVNENDVSSFFGIKGHVVFIPQDTTRHIGLLRMSPEFLVDIVKVVSTGRSVPDKSRVRSKLPIQKHKAYKEGNWRNDQLRETVQGDAHPDVRT